MSSSPLGCDFVTSLITDRVQDVKTGFNSLARTTLRPCTVKCTTEVESPSAPLAPEKAPPIRPEQKPA